jgi:hypothetical protein
MPSFQACFFTVKYNAMHAMHTMHTMHAMHTMHTMHTMQCNAMQCDAVNSRIGSRLFQFRRPGPIWTLLRPNQPITARKRQNYSPLIRIYRQANTELSPIIWNNRQTKFEPITTVDAGNRSSMYPTLNNFVTDAAQDCGIFVREVR